MMEKKFGREHRGKRTRIKYMAGSGVWEGNSFRLSHKLKDRANTGTHDLKRLPSDKGNLSGKLDKRRGGGVLGGRNEKQGALASKLEPQVARCALVPARAHEVGEPEGCLTRGESVEEGTRRTSMGKKVLATRY
ncbi:hypothetical protein GE21DRAFT_1087699 [Neurospora crassa]|nr:hypothetical protein GE21DRAFT_1087699 [Neurospora crassa]